MPREALGRAPRVDHGASEGYLYLSLALLVGALAALPILVGPGIVNTRAGGDSPFLLQRVHQLSENLRAGVFPSRWMWEGAHGLGYPFFSFYAALPYYVASALNLAGCGVLWGIKLTQVSGFVLAAWFTYHLARRLGAGPRAALLASACYTLAPFHLVNVYVRGDSLSEFYAQAWYPIILTAALALRDRPSAGSIAGLAGSYALLALTHNISAVLFSPLVATWIVVGGLSGARRLPGRALALGAGALILGLALAAWFWLPAVREQPLVQLQDQTTGYFHYPGHFRSDDLVQWRLVHDYGIDAERDPFSMGFVQAGVALLGLGLTAWRGWRRRRLSPYDALLAAALVLYTWLITPWSRVVWDHVPLLPYAQFPWRMLSVQALLVALLARNIPEGIAARRAGAALVGALVILVGMGGLGGLRVDRLSLDEADVTAQRLMLYETYSGNIGSTVRNEYLPADMVPRPHASGVQLNGGSKPMPLALEGRLASAEALHVGPGGEVWEVTVLEPALLAFHTTYYPGWEALVDGAPTRVRGVEGLGLVSLGLQDGVHRVELAYRGTRTQRYAAWLSVSALLVWLGLTLGSIWRARTTSRTAWRLAGAGLALAALGLALGRLAAAPAGSPGTPSGPLVMDMVRAPYLHAEPGGIAFGDALLTDYRIATDNPTPGEALEVCLTWQAAGGGCRVRLELLGATGHLYPPAPVWALTEALLRPPQQALTLDLPEDVPPGLYVPHLSVLCDGQPVAVRTARGQDMGTPGLSPVQVLGAPRDDTEDGAIAYYGPEQAPPVIALVAAGARMHDDMVEVALTWRSERQAPLNYMLSVRLLSSTGQQMAARDLPPLYGGYPTSLWRPGELLTDRVLLRRPQGADLAGAGLEIVLYDRRTLRAVGTARIEDALEG